ncbi:MAG: cohesin domain-containing protein, partial [Bacteroidota bacterium]
MKRILQLLPCLYFCLVSAWGQAQEPIIISFPETEVQLNAEFCIDVQATNFTDITAVQFAIEWDSDFLEYKSINLNIEEEVTYLPNLKESDFSVQDNILRFVWIDFAELNQRVTLPEGSTLFQICFKAADEESSASIEFSDAIVGEGVRASDLVSVPVIGEDATIQINSEAESSNNPRLSIGSKTVNVIRQFCVPIVAKDFEQLLGLQFSLRWNAEQLAFNKVKLGNNPLGIRESNYNYSNTHFGFQWSDFNAQDVPLPEEAELFELCFDAIAEANTQ